MSFFDRHVPVTSTLISMNERFSSLQHQAPAARSPRATAQISAGPAPSLKPASPRNRRLLDQFERKLETALALKLKKRSIQQRLGLGGRRPQPLRATRPGPIIQRLGIGGQRGGRNATRGTRQLVAGRGGRGRGRGRGGVNNLRRSNSVQSLQRSGSVQSLTGVGRRARSRSRSRSRLRMDDPALQPRARSRSRSRNRQGPAVARGRSRTRGRMAQGAYNNARGQQQGRGGNQPRRGRARSRSVNRFNSTRGGPRGGGGRRGGRRGRSANRAPVSKEALDKELDQYMSSSKDATDSFMKMDST